VQTDYGDFVQTLRRHLQLENQDSKGNVWLVSAPDLASHIRVPSNPPHRDKGAAEVAGWRGQCGTEVEAACQHAAVQLRNR
jgi:hypothetical protein